MRESVWLHTSVQACGCEHVMECVIWLGTGPPSGTGSGLGSLWLRAHRDLGVKFQPREGGGSSPLLPEFLKCWVQGGEVWERLGQGRGLESTTLWGSDHCQTIPGVSHFLMT